MVNAKISTLFGVLSAKSSLQQKRKSVPDITKSFVSKTSAHGFVHLSDPKAKIFTKVTWGFLLICFVGLFITNSVIRLQEYNESKRNVKYSQNILMKDEMPFPDISICSEGFSNEFLFFNWLKDAHDKFQNAVTNATILNDILNSVGHGDNIGK